MSSRYDSRIEAKIFLLTFSKFSKITFLNFKLFWWILAIGWYVIIVVYHYLDEGCVFREANSHFMNHYYKKHYMAIVFCAKMSLIEINLAQRRMVWRMPRERYDVHHHDFKQAAMLHPLYIDQVKNLKSFTLQNIWVI